MKKYEPTFDEFPKSGYQDWKIEATKLLKGENPEEKLQWSSVDGITLKPYYDQEDLANLAYLEDFFAEVPARHWVQYENIIVLNEKQANQHAKAALMGGCEGMSFKGDLSKLNLADLLDEVKLQHCYLAFEHQGERPFSLPDNLKQLKGFGKNVTSRAPHFRDWFIEEDEKGSIIQKTGRVIRKVISLLDQKNAALLFNKLVIKLKPGKDFFHELARIRATRLLLSKIALHYGLENSQVHIHVEPAPGKTESDHLVRQTTTGLASIIGGTDSISFHPGKTGWAENGAHRISRNIGNLIRHESKLDEVAEFSKGSYFIDSLTDQIARSVWEVVSEKK